MKADKMNRRNVLAVTTALVAAGAVWAVPATASDFPTRPIEVVVPFPAGGTTDVAARVFAERMERELGQPVVVENRAGGGGSVGADHVARANPDGHTLLFHNITFSATTTVMQHEGRALHDIEEDFAPVSIAVLVPMLLLAHPDLEIETMEEFVELARERGEAGEALFYGTTGHGSIMNLVGEVIKHEAEIDMEHVPFPGAAPMVQDLLAGRVQFGGDQLSTSFEHVLENRLVGLAVLADERNAALPDVPTVGEVGFDTLNLVGFNGFIAPAGTPDDVIERIRDAVRAAAEDPDVQQRMEGMGAVAFGSTPEEFREVLSEQVSQMRPLVERFDIGMGN